jgi:hypothetical protein
MNISNLYFPNIGYSLINFDEKELVPLREEVYEIQKNNFDGIIFNENLAGNIEKEFELTKSKMYVEKLLLPIILNFDKEFKYTEKIDLLTKNLPLKLYSLWVNFQSKHEFNPHHQHSGVFSFVIWLKIPYDIETEKKIKFSKNSNYNCPGHFEFAYSNTLGKLCTELIPADKKFENYGLLFTSNLSHSVHPFFSSDEYRISVSGNFKIDSS